MKKYLILFALCIPLIAFSQNRVGINTTIPDYILDIRGTDDVSEGGELQIATPSQSNYLRFFGGRLGDRNPFMAFHDKDTFHFVTTLPDWSTYTRRMTLLPTGNIGIGIDRPEARLHISTNSLLGYPQLRLTEEGYDYARIKMENDANPGIYWDIAGRSDSIPENSILNFFFRSSEGTGDRMTIRGNGRVGINNTSPEAKLDITGGDWNLEAGNPGDLRIGNSTYGLKMSMATGGGGAGAARIFADGGINTLVFGTDSTRRMTINGAGNVGIGIDNPQEKLHVDGGFRVSGLSGSGERNVIVDSNGKFKTGSSGGTDTDWAETSTHVISQKIARVAKSVTSGDPPFSITTTNYMDMGVGNLNSWRQFNSGAPFSTTLKIQNENDGNITLAEGGGRVGIGVLPGSTLTVQGFDNDGTIAALEVRSEGNGQVILMDGNEIDVAGTSSALHINANTGFPVTIGNHRVGSGYMLSVDGKVIAEEMRVQISGSWPDYVFKDEYNLMTLEEVDKSIKQNGHLPGIPSADVVEEEGVALGEMQRKMMEKIEELTLYMIELKKENKELKKRIERIEQ